MTIMTTRPKIMTTRPKIMTIMTTQNHDDHDDPKS
jgi:hypothetical protein